ncbi:MAG: MoxR family ATPase, partial [Myxococcota bacterium]|nr:MoxR family ATPase [Myxococcota bacterium]
SNRIVYPFQYGKYTMDSQQNQNDAEYFQDRFRTLQAEIGKVIVGQEDALKKVLLGFLCGGHVLLEGVPGLAKTLLIQTLSTCIKAEFSRIQFTPDMLPGDVTGTQIFNPREGTYSIRTGPVFGNIVLADEINRAPAKVQAALLEAMQEKQVTLGDETLKLPNPFLVLATQNPIEQEGTYPLPEAQLDRFMMKLQLHYPKRDEEIRILDRMAGTGRLPEASSVMDLDEIIKAQAAAKKIFVDDRIKGYTVDVVNATRFPKEYGCEHLVKFIENGASVRASLSLIKVAKARALMEGRTYVSPHDIKSMAYEVLRHRIALSYEAEAQAKTADDIIDEILEKIEVP